MKLERISEHKIKATLDFEDMKCLGMNGPEPDPDVLDTVLKIAYDKFRFERDKSKCKIVTETSEYGIKICITKDPDKCFKRAVLYFEDGNMIKDACRLLSAFKIEKSVLWCEQADGINTYYLDITYEAKEPLLDGEPYFISCVSELCDGVYCEKCGLFYYICEHCRKVIEKNAVFDIAKSEKRW